MKKSVSIFFLFICFGYISQVKASQNLDREIGQKFRKLFYDNKESRDEIIKGVEQAHKTIEEEAIAPDDYRDEYGFSQLGGSYRFVDAIRNFPENHGPTQEQLDAAKKDPGHGNRLVVLGAQMITKDILVIPGLREKIVEEAEKRISSNRAAAKDQTQYKYYIPAPRDEYFNSGLPHMIIKTVPDPDDQDAVRIIEPAESARKWETSEKEFLIECDGPASKNRMSHDEYLSLLDTLEKQGKWKPSPFFKEAMKEFRQEKERLKLEIAKHKAERVTDQPKASLFGTVASNVATAVGNKAQGLLPAQVDASAIPVGTLPIAIPGVSLPIRGQDFFKEEELDLVERELADRLKEEREREAREEERKTKGKTASTPPVPVQSVSNSTTNFFQATASAQDLRLQEARLKVEQLFAQLKKDREKEDLENRKAQDVVTNAHAQVMQQLTTLRSETTQLLEAFNDAGRSNSSNGSDGSSSSCDRGRDDGNLTRSGKGVSVYSGGSVCVASGCRDGYHSGKGGCDRSDNTRDMWGHD